ncbi:hypothetical protein GV64_10395 [Endozoicomonas elysicola]|uniref:Uncharacterized protein n=2 Tax=Endozoicomonas elysicola TaxID=305900 RepID=A0A081KAC3_9GAMM|nr:hypothetical protein GV64_10395 [Endozoicomonas elysicola]
MMHSSKLGSFRVDKPLQTNCRLALESSKVQKDSIATQKIEHQSPDKAYTNYKSDMRAEVSGSLPYDIVALQTTPEQFTDWDREKQSLAIRALFEKSSETVFNYSETSDTDKLEKQFEDASSRHTAFLLFGNLETGEGVNYKLISNDPKIIDILSNYNETLFKQTEGDQQIPFILENTYSITVSPEVIMRYTTADGVARLPHIQTVLQNSLWRNDAGLLTSTLSGNPENPDIVLRGIIRNGKELITPGYFYCDAHNAITQQLVNFQRTRPSNPLRLAFPDMEGRGGVFSIGNVPFHQYNSRSYNDFLCEHLGIFINEAAALRPVLKVPTGISVVELIPQEHHSTIPEIKMRQELPEKDYTVVLMMSLDQYIISSLEYQLTLPRGDRIPSRPGETTSEKASDTDIRRALTIIKELSKEKPGLSTPYTQKKP